MSLGLLLLPSSLIFAREATYDKLALFSRVLTLVENNYVVDVSPETLIYGAIQGMVSTLDAHSVFLKPSDYRRIRNGTQGGFGGLGLELTRDGQRLIVIAPIEKTPAALAGIRPGDEIVAIDGKRVDHLSLNAAVESLRGPVGSKVVLSLLRPEFSRPRELALKRARIEVSPVELTKRGDIGIIKIRLFQDRTTAHVRQALDQISKRRDAHTPGVILDLRGDPGGLLDEGVQVADLWLRSGVIVTTRGRTSPEEVQRAHRARSEANYPLVVLINEGSASASEIVAAALRENHRGLLVGTRSFGKGSVQTIIDLEDGSGLKLTIAHYYTPSGRSIQGLGIEPDFSVAPKVWGRAASAPSKAATGIKAGEQQKKTLQSGPSADLQLEKALEVVRNWKKYSKMLAQGAAETSGRVRSARSGRGK